MNGERRTARRIQGMKPSAIRLISDPAGPDAIPLGLGEPTWDMPEVAREALAQSFGKCPYGPNIGRVDLREEAARYLEVAGPEHVGVTIGTQGALYCLLTAFLDEGDELLVPDPGFVAYAAIARMSGGRVVPYRLAEDDRFRLDADLFCEALDGAKAATVAILNVPSNPTGGAASLETLRKIAAACDARDVLLISDEVYRELYFGERPPSLRDVTSEGVVVTSVSKAFGAPGLRVGFVAGPADVVKKAATVNAYAATAAVYPAQAAALALLRARDLVLPMSREHVRRRFSALQAALKEHLDQDVSPPDGSFYLWLPLPESAYADPFAFCVRLRDEGRVVLVPGDAFGPRGARHARLSFAASEAQLREGVRRLAPYFR